MKTEQPYELLFKALGEIRNALHEKISSLDEHIRRIQLDCAENVFQQQRDALTDCVEGIDQQVIKLAIYIDQYRRLYASLNALDTKIPGLGRKPLALPEATAGLA